MNHARIPIGVSRGGEVLGALAAYNLPKFEQARREILVDDLAIRRAHRREGIATALIERTRKIAKARGAWTVFIQAEPQDEAAVRLYSKLGTREEALHFDILVEEGGGEKG